MKFQVVCMDKYAYILEHKDFSDKQIGALLRYINNRVGIENNSKIEITRWNNKGERE